MSWTNQELRDYQSGVLIGQELATQMGVEYRFLEVSAYFLAHMAAIARSSLKGFSCNISGGEFTS